MKRLVVILGGLLLAGCGLVEVRIGPAPTATAPESPAALGQPSAGLVAASAPDDSQMVVHTIAYPHLVYSSSGPAIEMFEQDPPVLDMMIINTGLGYRLRVEWRALWESDVYGTGEISMDVYLRAPDAADYEYAQYAAAQPLEGYGSTFRSELLDATLYLPGSGRYGVKAVLRANAQDGNGGSADQEFTYEGEVIALDEPSDGVNNPPSDFAPPFGDLEANGILLDWRGWAFGPCFIQTEDNPTATRLLDEACASIENGDWGAADNALTAALDAAAEDGPLLGRLRAQLGTLASVQGQWNVAVRHFREAATVWESQDNALEVGIAYHNLGNALTAAGFWEEGLPTLETTAHLRDQMSDWRGSLLSWSQLGVYWQAADMLEGLADQLADNEMPQADWVRGYAASIRQKESQEASTSEGDG